MRFVIYLSVMLAAACGPQEDQGTFCQAGAADCFCFPGFDGGEGVCDDEAYECSDNDICVLRE